MQEFLRCTSWNQPSFSTEHFRPDPGARNRGLLRGRSVLQLKKQELERPGDMLASSRVESKNGSCCLVASATLAHMSQADCCCISLRKLSRRRTQASTPGPRPQECREWPWGRGNRSASSGNEVIGRVHVGEKKEQDQVRDHHDHPSVSSIAVPQ